MPARPAQRVYRSWVVNSGRWGHYRPRASDIVIATYPKCGTTWMQRIISLLVFQDPEPRPVMQISPWIDRRAREPIEAVMARIDAQDHRRFLKAHLPADGLLIFDEVKYVHVARDGRDAAMSFHNHGSGLTPEVLEALDRSGLEDERVGRPYPRVPADPADYFHRWLTEEVDPAYGDSSSVTSFLHFARTWWKERHRPNVLLVHYNDLKADLPGEMRRIADFLGTPVPLAIWPGLSRLSTSRPCAGTATRSWGAWRLASRVVASGSFTKVRTGAGAASFEVRISPCTTPSSEPNSRPPVCAGRHTAVRASDRATTSSLDEAELLCRKRRGVRSPRERRSGGCAPRRSGAGRAHMGAAGVDLARPVAGGTGRADRSGHPAGAGLRPVHGGLLHPDLLDAKALPDGTGQAR